VSEKEEKKPFVKTADFHCLFISFSANSAGKDFFGYITETLAVKMGEVYVWDYQFI